MKRTLFALVVVVALAAAVGAQEEKPGLRGDPAAIAEARAMVNAMGGIEIWARLQSVHFVHRWYFWNRIDSYVEDEILDLAGPRSWVEMKSEIYHRLRAYSPEQGYWNVVNGEFSRASEEALAAAMERAPYNLCRIARAVAVDDPEYEVRFGEEEFPGTRQLEFCRSDGHCGGWVVLNARKEPLVWATTQYRYTFGPMRPFGNLRYPDWAVTGNGAVTYEMISLTGDDEPPDPSLFVPPDEFEPQRR
jgi:hypothetical protein